MNIAPASMYDMLASGNKDPLWAVEFYTSAYVPDINHGFEPDQAVARFATETVPVYVFRAGVVVDYVESVLSIPTLSRNIGKQSNSVSVAMSNVPKSETPTIQPIASFVLNNEIEGMRMVIRLLSRANLPDTLAPLSWVLFVGRCQRQDGFDRQRGSITAKQDFGQINAVIPPWVFQKDCPLVFGGPECLGTELLTEKNAAYQAAFAALGRKGCNKTDGQCFEYENLEFRQGIRIVQLQGSFIHRPHESFLQKLIGVLTPGSGKRRITVGASLEDGVPYGKAIPMVLGRALMPGIPLQYQDIGTAINFLMAFSRGPIVSFNNTRVLNPGFSAPQGLTEHHGYFGGQGDQTADTVFPEHGFFSRLAYNTGFVTGSDIAVEDPAPDMVSMIGGDQVPHVILFGDSTSGEGTTSSGVYDFGLSLQWSDNPVDQVVHNMIDGGLLNIPTSFIDQQRTSRTSVYTTGAIRDNTNGERLVLPNSEIGKAGVEYHRYNSTGLIAGEGGDIPSLPTFAGIAHEAEYEFYDENAPPTSTPLKTFYRKRYTSNIGLTEQRKVIDFLHDTLLPTFRGFFSWDTHGRIGVRCERPADSSLMYEDSVADASVIKINDATLWKVPFNENNDPLIGKVLIGVGLNTSEVRSVVSAQYTADGNSITLDAAATGGTVLTASGVNLTGGSTTTRAAATIEVSVAGAKDDVLTVTIDGEECVYTLTAGDAGKIFKTAKALAFAINAHPVINKYVVANNATFDSVIQLSAKLGTLTLSSPLEEDHDIGEETIRVMMSFASSALTYADCTRSNILNGSFRYLGSDGQTRYNQFKGKFHPSLQDFAEREVIVNDEVHQETHELKPLEMDLSAVDNYWQAAQLLNGAAAKFGDGVDFFAWDSNGLALQLEEGDVVCVSHYAGKFRNQAVRIEALSWNDKFQVSFDRTRVYSTSMFDDEVRETSVALVSGLINFGAKPPAIQFDTLGFPPDGLTKTTTGTIGITSVEGGAIFGASLYPQYAKVGVKKPGSTEYVQLPPIRPDSDFKAKFEFIAPVPGPYEVQLEVCGTWGCNVNKPTAVIIVGLGTAQGDWRLPMITISGSGTVGPTGSGSFIIP